jgi:hypothetical protein
MLDARRWNTQCLMLDIETLDTRRWNTRHSTLEHSTLDVGTLDTRRLTINTRHSNTQLGRSAYGRYTGCGPYGETREGA